MAELIRVVYETEHGENKTENGGKKRMTDNTMEFVKGSLTSMNSCPSCGGGLDFVSGEGEEAPCPWCDAKLKLTKDGNVELVEAIEAGSSEDGLTPQERRIARDLGVSSEEAQQAKQVQ